MILMSTQNSNSSSNSPTIFVIICPEIIDQRVNELAYKKFTWDELNWLVSENNLRLAKATKMAPNLQTYSYPGHIPVDPSKIIMKPNHEAIRHTAEKISKLHLPISDLQWVFAIQDFILEEINIH